MNSAVVAVALLLVPLVVADAQYIAPAPACYAPTVTLYETVTEVQTETETAFNTVVEEVVQTETAFETETNTETETEFVTETLVETNTEIEQVRKGHGKDIFKAHAPFFFCLLYFVLGGGYKSVFLPICVFKGWSQASNVLYLYHTAI